MVATDEVGERRVAGEVAVVVGADREDGAQAAVAPLERTGQHVDELLPALPRPGGERLLELVQNEELVPTAIDVDCGRVDCAGSQQPDPPPLAAG